METRALVLFSAGIDSTTALYWARKEFAGVTALTFDYSQKHRLEVTMARRLAVRLKIDWRVWKLPLKNMLHSALLDDDRPIPEKLELSRNQHGLPLTYVPFRNGIFLSLAAAYGESNGVFDLVTGFNRIDTPDYPDTTEAFTAAMEKALNQGTGAEKRGRSFKIHTPLIGLRKKEIIQMGIDLGADYSYSISCYRGAEMPCGRCPSCEIRNRAFAQLGRPDPLVERLERKTKR